MIYPLAEIVTLLQPAATLSKTVSGAGQWRFRRTDVGQPFYCVVLEGACRLAVSGRASILLAPGDFVLIPAAHDFTFSSVEPPASGRITEPTLRDGGEVRLGMLEGSPDVVFLVGHCAFGSPNAALLVSLLPDLVHVRGEARLATLVAIVAEETRGSRPARGLMLLRLLEVLLIEALRSSPPTDASAGLVRGLADKQLAVAIRRMHENPGRAWSVTELAAAAALSRSTFFDRIRRAVGLAPMDYLLTWRMALAQELLRQRAAGRPAGIAEVARRVGYGSAARSASRSRATWACRRGSLPTGRHQPKRPLCDSGYQTKNVRHYSSNVHARAERGGP